ncbi:MAG: Na+/H+ antiporter NhaA [Alphaproteobacteria bacterium]|nr:Na+/H+ antiporter NhaA [Alphaproteobacteria bacterium]
MPLRFINKFLHGQYSSSIVLIFATALAMFLANSFAAESYHSILQAHFGIKTDFLTLDLSVEHWVNDGLMVLFFLLVGLEIKREFMQGELGTLSKAAFPVICAVGGVVAPALIFLFINKGHHEHWQGWAIPTATDIAFALGLLALGGKNVPLSLKVFLTALAIIDDLIAILIIALFYGEPLNIDAFFVAVVVMFVLLRLNVMNVKRIWPYLLMGFFLWLSVLQSGLHPTIAGVLLAIMIPVSENKEKSPLHRLENALHPVSAFFIMPVFALVNAGLLFSGISVGDLWNPLPLGIMAGLFFGKQIGIVLAGKVAIHLGWAQLPEDVSPRQFYAASVLAGIGFTMSLFIGSLAFKSGEQDNLVRLGVMAGSLISAIVGVMLLRWDGRKKIAAN